MERKEMIEFISSVSAHTEKEVKAIAKGMSDKALNNWYFVEKCRTERELEEMLLDVI